MENKIFNLALDYIHQFLGKDETNTSQLDDFSKKFLGNQFAGVYPSDKLNRFLNTGKKYCVMNVDPSYLSGSHWVACVKDGKDLLVFDSFGRKTSKLIPSLMGNGLNVIDTDYDKDQQDDQNDCGPRSIAGLFIHQQFGRKMFLKL